ncbi:hypothetical protein B0J12DRAFT_37096 [Macrophomina phaseolina]|uniref:Uncharacterized protein n=1 Tax=Macrophomina phaseolina TaxID=35725 RepID=A0ABQ8GW56_9PEZI|nr:hypothetical protein B0J12DRAFT_37096 [Macrophomina phaseolina]
MSVRGRANHTSSRRGLGDARFSIPPTRSTVAIRVLFHADRPDQQRHRLPQTFEVTMRPAGPHSMNLDSLRFVVHARVNFLRQDGEPTRERARDRGFFPIRCYRFTIRSYAGGGGLDQWPAEEADWSDGRAGDGDVMAGALFCVPAGGERKAPLVRVCMRVAEAAVSQLLHIVAPQACDTVVLWRHQSVLHSPRGEVQGCSPFRISSTKRPHTPLFWEDAGGR